MWLLLIASLVWALSFGLIKHFLAGVDASFVAFVRLGISFLVFLPFLRVRRLTWRGAGELILLGTVQYGLMYLYYLQSFAYLEAHQVALFTVFTPIYVALIHDAMAQRFHSLYLLTALLAVAGAAVIVYTGRDLTGTAVGFLLVQVSNLCFAFGQVRYREVLRKVPGMEDYQVFALMYLGAAAVAGVPVLALGPRWLPGLTWGQGLLLLYLGAIPAGLCFFLWNVGARRVNAGTLAAFNNAKVPLAVLASVFVFGERPPLWPLFSGGGFILLAVLVNEYYTRGGMTDEATGETDRAASG